VLLAEHIGADATPSDSAAKPDPPAVKICRRKASNKTGDTALKRPRSMQINSLTFDSRAGLRAIETKAP